MTAYYNEIDPYAAQWLRNLIDAGHIAPGVVDERSIEDVRPSELAGFTQCHFFAGVGVWSLALRRAGWPDDRPVWTGSCPCQPFSAAGKGAGFADERHLWPAFFWLIDQCRPAAIFGEQVASKDVNPWINLVQADLEAVGYGVGCVAFPSAGVGAPHIRDRAYWVADANGERLNRFNPPVRGESLGHAQANVRGKTMHGEPGVFGSICGMPRQLGGMGHPDSRRRQPQLPIIRIDDAGVGSPWWEQVHGIEAGSHVFDEQPTTGPTNGNWGSADWLLCRDGKWRPVEPGTFPLANGATARVGRLRAYGNAINAEAAKEFIAAFLDCAN